MSHGDNQQFRRHNTHQQTVRVHVDKSEVRAALRGKEAFSLHDVFIRIKVPYDPVNGGVKPCHCGGAKVGHLVARLGA